MHDHWIADRMRHIESSGIRKVFELARSLQDPVNLSIGQPDFDVPAPIKTAAKEAIDCGFNGYTVTQGIPELRNKIAADVRQRYPHHDRELFITSVIYPHLITLAGGTTVYVDTYPDFRIDLDKVRAALSPRTKAILVNSPANPSGMVLSRESLRDLAELARERRVLLLSDEVYRVFCYDTPFCSPAEFNDEVVVFDGFSKAYGMTGWRMGFAHGPKRLIEEMIKLQQFSFVCAPSMVQHAGVVAWDYDVSGIVADYRRKRDRVYEGLRQRYEMVKPSGAFYLFAKAPWGTATEFVAEAIHNNLLIIPGNVFSRRDSHFRLSYAAAERTIDRGLEILNRLARR